MAFCKDLPEPCHFLLKQIHLATSILFVIFVKKGPAHFGAEPLDLICREAIYGLGLRMD